MIYNISKIKNENIKDSILYTFVRDFESLRPEIENCCIIDCEINFNACFIKFIVEVYPKKYNFFTVRLIKEDFYRGSILTIFSDFNSNKKTGGYLYSKNIISFSLNESCEIQNVGRMIKNKNLSFKEG
jgi:hypothetical protein